MSAAPNERFWRPVLGLAAAGNLINGLWMLASPAHWYWNLPANVPGSGPLNEHFVRDVGCVFTLMGIALAVAVARPSWRVGALAATAAFSVAHALVHVLDSARGLFPAGQWSIDLVPIYGTAALTVWLLARANREAH